MTRKIIRVPSGRASLENDRLESGARKSWRRCGPAWANAFGPGPAGGGGDLLPDGMTIGWDIWSRFCAMAWDEQGDRLAREIDRDILKRQEDAP